MHIRKRGLGCKQSDSRVGVTTWDTLGENSADPGKVWCKGSGSRCGFWVLNCKIKPIPVLVSSKKTQVKGMDALIR